MFCRSTVSARQRIVPPPSFSSRRTYRFGRKAVVIAAAAAVAQLLGALPARATDVSAPVIIQDFESTWQSVTNKMPDIFAAGYGGVYTPPPSRAESGNQSVGYDVYDRFDLGSAGNPTLYGTQSGLSQMISSIHAMGGSSYIDLVWNHNGFADEGTSGFAAAGGYPGFALTLQTTDPTAPGYNTQGYNVTDGDYHSAYATGDQQERLAGLIDISQESNNVFIRQPTVAGTDNIPGPTPGATGWNGHALANVPNAANAQYYPSLSGTPQTFTDPDLGGQSFTRYNFNNASPMSGTPVAENATGYLERYAQYMVQVLGADGFRVDAAKNMPTFVMNYLDLATYQASNRYLLNGSREQIFNYSEVYDSSFSTLQSYVNKDSTGSATTVGGNRDVLDFPLFFAMQSNLTGTTANNSWYNVVNASFDTADDGEMNGSQGVKFVSSQDNGPPALSSVAYAYTLMLPGNTMVYFNGHNFGTESDRSFPEDGREDALGGVYGNQLTTLVDLRNRFGRGNYRQDYIETNNFAFERTGSSLVMLSNNTQAGFDSRTIDVTFAPGTPLLEMTGNAHGSSSDPHGDIPQLLIVNADSSSPTGASVNARFLHNSTYDLSNNSVFTGDGYLVYGLPTPTGTLGLTNVAGTFGGVTAKTTDANVAYENGTQLNSTVDVIKSTSTQLQLNTVLANLLGYYRDHDADGDNAILKVDGGVDVAGTNGLFIDPTNQVTYGFEGFNTKSSPGYAANSGAGGAGQYLQNIDLSKLGQGYHYITVEAFRHRDDGGPAVYTDWKQTIYVDLAPPNSALTGFADDVAGVNENRQLAVKSVDGLANSVHTFLDLPFGLTDAQVLAMISSTTQANNLDVNLYEHYYSGVTSGNHSATVVSYKPDGTYNIQRFSTASSPFLATSTLYGAGIGDANFDGSINASDISVLSTVVQSGNTQFNAADDVNGDGYVDLADTFLMGPVLSAHSADNATFAAFNAFINGSYVTTHTYTVNGTNNIYEDTAGTTNLAAGSNLVASYVRGNALTLAAGSTAQIRYNGTSTGVSKVGSLTLSGTAAAPTSTLDLTNNTLDVNYGTGADPTASIRAMLIAGRNGGAWTGMGITSSSAAANPTKYGLGYADGADNVVSGLTAGDTLIKYTLVGDANLDGVVNFADLGILLNNYGKAGVWDQGDFDYSGTVGFADLGDLLNNYNASGISATISATAYHLDSASVALLEQDGFTVTGSSVPEPTMISAFGIAALLLRRRRGSIKCSILPM